MKRTRKNEKGFSLLECLFSLVITMFGLMAVVGLIATSINLQTYSRDTSAATRHAKAKIEQLRNFAPTSGSRARGGSLLQDVTNYMDSPDARFKRRWLIESHPTDSGVPQGTQRLTVRILSNRSDIVLPPLQVQALVPQS